MHTFRNLASTAILLAGLVLPASAQTNVPYSRILESAAEPGNWLTNLGTYDGHRFSTLNQINDQNVSKLRPGWIYQQAGTEKWEVTPIVVDGVMFISERPNIVTALDARTGRPLWNYRRPLPDDVPVCCGRANRGVAILGDAVYLNTFDSHLVCIDANTGLERWDTVVEDYHGGVSMTGAPLALKDKVLVGMAGGEFGVRGFVDAYDAKTGKKAWRCWTIPGPGEPGNDSWGGESWKIGGGSTWGTGTFDPALNTVYWGTGNPSPDYDGDVRPGDNKWTCSVIAINPDDGKIKWGFQFTPHDTHDWDSNQIPVLIDAPINGQMRKLLTLASRNSFYYVLDRTNGQFLAGQAYAKQTWATGLDQNGRPMALPGKEPNKEGVLVYPGLGGNANWPPPSYNPQTGLVYIQAREDYGQYFYKYPTEYSRGQHFEAGGGRNVLGEEAYGVVKALEATTGKQKWEFRIQSYAHAPILSTAGNLVISGTAEGQVYALDAKTGKLLWQFMIGSTVYGGPVTYLVDGKQQIAVSSGAGLFVFSL